MITATVLAVFFVPVFYVAIQSLIELKNGPPKFHEGEDLPVAVGQSSTETPVLKREPAPVAQTPAPPAEKPAPPDTNGEPDKNGTPAERDAPAPADGRPPSPPGH
jgi:HAE1 family hydrophobic/amphiphilic exporter-1